ncbi:MCE family protein [Nocardioides sp. zg-536]|uniref:MCE family protein n=1 Tax=Nocardioides faecalis TaxID=2803858 RepID=A0A938Y8F6_9ACTN|nr:MlaD family protein [Nocardioides faecalis]MBM9461129.1 MCE family protein [Nocardioides faecalis]QVI58985.1 MCE family protein [Nocardioides faecalis]
MSSSTRLTRSVRLKLVAFGAVIAATTTYGASQFFDLSGVLHDPDRVRIQFSDPGGIYPRADVELLGTRVGSVVEVLPGPGTGSTVVVDLRHDADVPADLTATVSSKSAIGEQYVALTPRSADGPRLGDGDLVTLAATTPPPDLAQLIGNLDALAGSVDPAALATILDEATLGLEGVGPALGSVLDDADSVTRTALDSADDLTALIDSAQRVLDTQVDLLDETRAGQADLAALTTRLRRLDDTLDDVLRRGIGAGSALQGLLEDNQAALPRLLDDLVAITDVAADRLPHLRKGLVVFPHVLEQNIQTLRHCDTLDPVTGKAVESTCHYDDEGNPIYSAHIAIVLPTVPLAPPCTKGYETKKKYNPDGTPADGKGPRQPDDAPVSDDIRCSSSPYDATGPNVRGFQNAPKGGTRGSGGGAGGPGALGRSGPVWGQALFNPASGIVVTPDGRATKVLAPTPPDPTGTSTDAAGDGSGLGWLLTRNLEE